MHEEIISKLQKDLDDYKEALRTSSLQVAKLAAEKKQILDASIRSIEQADREIKQLGDMIEDVKMKAVVIVDSVFNDHPRKNYATSEITKLGPARIG